MLANELYKMKQAAKPRGLPMREPAQRRIYNTPDGRNPNDPVEYESPFSLMRDQARAISIQRRMDETKRSLIAQGVDPDTAKKQSEILLAGATRNVVLTIEEMAAGKSLEEKKSAAIDLIAQKMDTLNASINAMRPEEVLKNMMASEVTDRAISGALDDVTSRPRPEMAAPDIPKRGDSKKYKAGKNGNVLTSAQQTIMERFIEDGKLNLPTDRDYFRITRQYPSAEWNEIRDELRAVGINYKA